MLIWEDQRDDPKPQPPKPAPFKPDRGEREYRCSRSHLENILRARDEAIAHEQTVRHRARLAVERRG